MIKVFMLKKVILTQNVAQTVEKKQEQEETYMIRADKMLIEREEVDSDADIDEKKKDNKKDVLDGFEKEK